MTLYTPAARHHFHVSQDLLNLRCVLRGAKEACVCTVKKGSVDSV